MKETKKRAARARCISCEATLRPRDAGVCMKCLEALAELNDRQAVR